MRLRYFLAIKKRYGLRYALERMKMTDKVFGYWQRKEDDAKFDSTEASTKGDE